MNFASIEQNYATLPVLMASPLSRGNTVTNKTKRMNLVKLMPIMAMLLVGLITGCSKSADSVYGLNETSDSNLSVDSSENPSDLKSAAILSKNGTLEVVDLGIAGDFAILSKTGVTSVYKSSITGDIGTSPITGAAMVLSCGEVTGNIYSVDAAGPACKITSATRLGIAVLNMQAAYTDAAGRVNPDFLNLGAGNIGGKTLTAGLYKFTSALVIPTDITISGSPTDVWIFQVAGTLNMSSAVRITLAGGAQAKNIFWQTSGAVTIGTTSHFEGIIMSQTGINMKTGASINGRMLAQTAVTLQMNAVTQPK